MVYAYVKAWVAGLFQPTQQWTVTGRVDNSFIDAAAHVGFNHGRWIGRWLHGCPTKAMIFKVFVLIAGVLIGTGFISIYQFYRPLTGLVIGTTGLVMLSIWGISDDDLKDS